MRFSARHEFPAAVPAVAAVLADPAFYTALQLPDVALPELLDHDTDASRVTIRLRYTYAGQLDPVARRVLAGRTLAWVQTLALDLETYTGTLEIAGDGDDRLQGRASVALSGTDAPAGPGATRAIEGDFRIRVPIVGGQAEKRIVPGLLARLDVEAAAVRASLLSG